MNNQSLTNGRKWRSEEDYNGMEMKRETEKLRDLQLRGDDGWPSRVRINNYSWCNLELVNG